MKGCLAGGLAAVLFVAVGPGARGQRGECTVAVVSGRATTHGRPLLWKSRDIKARPNKVVRFAGRGLASLGLVTAGRDEAGEVWAGLNEAGFALMNSASDDLDGPGGDGEGRFMREALDSCRSVDDFARLLAATDGPGRAVRANFGAIDAAGGAAFFEAGAHRHRRFDAADPGEAPQGFLVRANFAFTGAGSGAGFGRYERARRLLAAGAAAGGLDEEYLLGRVCRDLFTFSRDPYPLPAAGPPLAMDATICRRSTMAVALFAGVGPGQEPGLACFWLILGPPLAVPAVPLFVAAGPPPVQVTGPPGEGAPLWAAAWELHRRLAGPGEGLLDLARLARLSPREGVPGAVLDLERGFLAQVEGWRGRAEAGRLAALSAECAARAAALVQSQVELLPAPASRPARVRL